MKYIRTKDGIFDNWIMDGVMPERINAQTFGIEAIKYADTIEELCDEFVLYYLPLEEMSNNESWIPYAQYERRGVWQKMRNEIIDKTLKSKSTLYGAIWTDKGLIYVAKMNDKGELELL